MVELDISKFIPGAGGQPRAVFREDPDLKKAKEIGLIMTAVSVVIIIILSVAIYVIANNWKAVADAADGDAQTLNSQLTKYRNAERQANDIANLSSAVGQALDSKTNWSLFFTELSQLTPKNIVYLNFSAGSQSVSSIAEQATGLAVGSFSSSLADMIKLNGADKFLSITKLKINSDNPDWLKLTEDQKTAKLMDLMKQDSFWDAENLGAAVAIDDILKLTGDNTHSLFSQTIDMKAYLLAMATTLTPENQIKITGKADSYLSVARLITSLRNSKYMKDIVLTSASLSVSDLGVQSADFSLNLSFMGDIRSASLNQPTETMDTENTTETGTGQSTSGEGAQ